MDENEQLKTLKKELDEWVKNFNSKLPQYEEIEQKLKKLVFVSVHNENTSKELIYDVERLRGELELIRSLLMVLVENMKLKEERRR